MLLLSLTVLVVGCRQEAVPDDRVVVRIYAREYEWCARGHAGALSVDDCAVERLKKSVQASGLVLPSDWPALLDIWREVAYLTQVRGWSPTMSEVALERRLEQRGD